MNATELSAEIRTVEHAAVYLQELKAKATELTTRVSAERRGYFTPDEEDAALGLLVSYWQTRNALFDLIGSLRREAAGNDPPADAFVIGFAAAAVLVDAGRFLREVAAIRPVVRDKLNEASPEFGIPQGVYDTIQRSLLSARNGWHLLVALNHYKRIIEPQERELGEELRPLIAVIKSLLPQLEVSVSRFAQATLKTRANRMARRVKGLFIDRTLYGLQRFAGTLFSNKFVRLGHKPGLPAAVAAEFRSLLLPGDVLVTRKEYALTNYFLPGYWPHAALYLGTAEQLNGLGISEEPVVRARGSQLAALSQNATGVVLESLKDGVHLRTLESPFASDSVIVLRPKLVDREIARGIARVLAHESKPYDFDFDFRRSDRLVCTEVVYRAFDGLGNLSIPLVRRAGRPTLSGSDIIRHAIRRELFRPVAVFAPGLVAGVRYVDDVLPVLRTGEPEWR